MEKIVARNFTAFKGSKPLGSSDRWQVLEVGGETPHYRLMLSWYDNFNSKTPGYWRIYTITDYKETDSYHRFYTIDGRHFNCLKEVDYGMPAFAEVYLKRELVKQDIPFNIMLWDTNWSEINWKIYETEGE